MSIALEILEGLWNTSLYYKGMRVNIFGISRPWKGNNASARTTMSRLHKKGLVVNKLGKWSITENGKKYLKSEKKKIIPHFNSPLKKDAPKNLIVMFDIPESRKIERNWFRSHLIKFDYIMIQKSVWVGPSPLPKEFVSYVKEIGLKSCIKSFNLAKPYKFIKNKI